MRHFTPVVLLVGLICFGLQAQIPNPGSEGKRQLPWMPSYDEALKKAEAEKKPLLIDITTDWCGWSKKMERETFADPAVQKEVRDFVLVRINPEASDANQKIAESFNVSGYPTLIIANYKGEEISQGGYMQRKDFLEFLNKMQPLFKKNPLGYTRVQLGADDPLMQVIGRIPAPDARPTSVGSFIVLDQTRVDLQANGAAKFLVRTATFVADPEKGDLPNAHIRYVSSRQKAKFKAVRILDAKGAGRELDLRLAKDEHAYSNQNVYWDVRSLYLQLPTLKEGDIVDVIEEQEWQPVITNQFYFRWNTGTHILLRSHITLNFPPALNLQKRYTRCSGKVKETRNADGTLSWELITSHPDPYEPVLFSPSLHEIWEGCDFYTPCTQNVIAEWYAGLCRGRDELPEAALQKIAELKRASTNQTALLQGILDWVTKDVRYVSVLFGASAHQPHPAKDTLKDLYGDCKDQSLLLQALCRKAGLSASLVLLDAGGSGFSEESPAVEMFNHCILEATADGKPYYLDPAWGPAKLGHIAAAYAGSKALKLDNRTGAAITLPPYKPRSDDAFTAMLVKLNTNGSGTITETAEITGKKAEQMKEQMKGSNPAKYRRQLEEAYKKAGRKLLDFYMTPTNAVGDKYETRISYTVPTFGSKTAGGLVFRLSAQTGSDDWISALNVSRTQPFRFHPSDVAKSTYTVELPAGAKLKSRPEDLQLDTPFIEATRKLEFKDNKLSMTESYRLKDARLEASEADKVYEAFRKLEDHRGYTFIVEMPRATTEP